MGKRNKKGQFTKNSVFIKYEQTQKSKISKPTLHDHDYVGSYTTSNDTAASETLVAENVVVSTDEDYSWKSGRRIVSLDILAKGLSSCLLCRIPLSLHCCVKEQRFSLGSYLFMRCNNCHTVNKIPTGRQHSTFNKGPPSWDVNVKTSLGKNKLDIALLDNKLEQHGYLYTGYNY